MRGRSFRRMDESQTLPGEMERHCESGFILRCFDSPHVVSGAMRFLFRWAFRLLLLLIVLGVALALLKDTLLRALAEQRIRTRTGLEARIERVRVGVLSPSLTIESLKLYNTAEFGGSPLLDIPELHLECAPGPLALRKLHFKLVRLEVRELNVVESKDGRTNVTELISGFQESTAAQAQDRALLDFEFTGIDVLNLSVERIRYSTLKQPKKDMNVEAGLRNEILTGVKSLPELTDVLMNRLFNRGITITSQGGRTSVTVLPKRDSPATSHSPWTVPAPERVERAQSQRN